MVVVISVVIITHHHLVDSVDDAVHLLPCDVPVVVNVVQPERPCTVTTTRYSNTEQQHGAARVHGAATVHGTAIVHGTACNSTRYNNSAR